MKSRTSTLPPAIALVVAVLAVWWWCCWIDHPYQRVIIRHPSEVETLPIDGAFGGESIAFDSDSHGPYVGVSDGRIIKWDSIHRRWRDFAFTSSNRNYVAAFITGDSTGRFTKYDMKTKQVSVLVDNLKFPNGVSLSKDGRSVMIIESVTRKVLRYWLEGSPKNGTLENVTELSGFPDNIKRNANGEYWIGVYSKKTRLSQFVFARPWVGNFIASRPKVMRIVQAIVRMKAVGMGFKLSEEGEILMALEDRSGILRFVSEVEDKEGALFFGSVIMPFVGVYKNKSMFD